MLPETKYVPTAAAMQQDSFVNGANTEISTGEQKKKNTPAIVLGLTAAAAIATSCVLLFKNRNLNKAANNAQDALQNLQKTASDAADTIQNLQKASAKQFQDFLFPSGLDKLHLQQQNVGDCYLLSSLYALSRNKKGQEALRKMVELQADGSFKVVINGKDIVVQANELLGQMTHKGFKESVNSDPGIKIIERAYARYEKTYGKLTGRPASNPNVSMMAVSGGFNNKTIEALVGYQKVGSIGKAGYECLSQQGLKGSDIEAALKKLPQSDYILTAGTPSTGKYKKTVEKIVTGIDGKVKKQTDVVDFMDRSGKFHCGHAYAIDSVDFVKGTVRVVNPHNTMHEAYNLTFDQVAKCFDEIFVNKVA